MKLKSLKIAGNNYPYNERDNKVNYEGEWREVLEDQEGDLYIMHEGAMYLNDLNQKKDGSISPSTNIEQREGFTGEEWFVDKGDYDRTENPGEVYIRMRDGDENYDLCNFGGDETGNTLANAAIIGQSKNMYRIIEKLLEEDKKVVAANSPHSVFTIKEATEILLKANPKQ